MKCSICHNQFTSQEFSKAQIKKPENTRKCKYCIQNTPIKNEQIKIFTPVGSSTQSYILEKRYIEMDEYEHLKRENADLKNRIATYEGTFVKLHEEIQSRNLEIEKRNTEIDILRKENKELKKKIEMLEKQIAEQNQKIDYLTEQLMTEKTAKMTNKCLIAIQDLNSTDFLEKSDFFSKNARNELFYLREHRNGNCHFILENDTNDFKTHKLNDLLEHLRNCEPQIKEKLEILTGGIIAEIENYLTEKLKNTVLVSLTKREEYRLSNWWVQ